MSTSSVGTLTTIANNTTTVPANAASVLQLLQTQLGSNGVPATMQAVVQSIATNSPIFQNIIGQNTSSILRNSLLNATGDSSSNIQSATSSVINNLVTAVTNLADTNLTIPNNSMWIKGAATSDGIYLSGAISTNFSPPQLIASTILIPSQGKNTNNISTSNKTSLIINLPYTTYNSSSIANDLVPFMRTIYLTYIGAGFKPSANFNAYFGGVDVTSYITPAQELLVSSISGKPFNFDCTTNRGGTTEPARMITNNPINDLIVGDIITGMFTNTTGILVGIEQAPDDQLRLFVVNAIGNFSSSEEIIGSISGALGAVTSVTKNPTGMIISSPYGSINGIFEIPNSPALRFPVGTSRLLFSTGASTNITAESFGQVDFVSNGILQTSKPTVSSIRTETQQQHAYNTTSLLSSSASISNKLVSPVSNSIDVAGTEITSNYNQTVQLDPLAETFFVSEPSGIYVTAIDLFFASADTLLPIYVSIVNTVNGNPGSIEINESRTTISPYDIILSPNLTTLADGSVVASADTPCKISFKAPIYLQGQTEYAIFIKTDSVKYKLWSSYLGDTTLNDNGITSAQTIMGSLYKSQNATTWITDPNKNLCFNLYRASFNTNVVSSVKLKNTSLISKTGQYDPFYFTDGSNLVRILSLGHGFQNGHFVTISGLVTSAITTVGNFVTGIEYYYVTPYLDPDYCYSVGNTYVITSLGSTTNDQWNVIAGTTGKTYIVGSSLSPIMSGKGMGTGTASSGNYYGFSSNQINNTFIISNVEPDYYTIQMPYAATGSGVITDPNVRLTYNATIDNICPWVQNFTPINTKIDYNYLGTNTSNAKSIIPTSILNYIPLDTSETLLVLSADNETNFLPSSISSLNLNIELSSTNELVSPMIDTHRMNVVTTGYKINNPSRDMNVSGLDFIDIAINSPWIFVDMTNNSFNTIDLKTQSLISNMIVGQCVTLTGCTDSIFNNGTFVVTFVASDGSYFSVDQSLGEETSNSISISLGTRFIDEISPVGSSAVSKYVSKQLTFENLSTSFNMFFDYNLPSGSAIEFYYKTSDSNSGVSQSSLNYKKMVYPKSLIVSSNTKQINAGNIQIDSLANFDTLSIKVVYKSNNSNTFPRLSDFRIVALA